MYRLLASKSLSSTSSYVNKISRATYVSVRDVLFGQYRIDEEISYQLIPNENDLFPTSIFSNGRYVSPYTIDTHKNIGDVTRLFFYPKKPKINLKNHLKLGETSTKLIKNLIKEPNVYNSSHTTSDSSETIPSDEDCPSRFTWVGHASCLFESNGFKFLTDPIWGDRASPFPFLGPKRYIKPTIELEKLFPVDFVLLSHTHFDHLCYETAMKIGEKAHWIVPLGTKKWFLDNNIQNVTELDWWQTFQYKDPETGKVIKITFTPTKHWTTRTPLDLNDSLWGSYIINTSKDNYFFTGDTAYCNVFDLIGKFYGPFDLAAIPIGAYSPRFFMKNVHCNPEEAVRIHQDLKSKQSVGIHWGTFPLTTEDRIEPPLELARIREELNLSSGEFFTMYHGETINIGEKPENDFADKYPEIFKDYLQWQKETDLKQWEE